MCTVRLTSSWPAIRVIEHLQRSAPVAEGPVGLLPGVGGGAVPESRGGSRTKGVISIIRSGGDTRFAVRDHTRIETLPRSTESAQDGRGDLAVQDQAGVPPQGARRNPGKEGGPERASSRSSTRPSRTPPC
ncbi:MAG: hypothetical protein MZV70_42110 [Desulfobacterales bacterium]|nr:hypothetical protein [Desulfobacterales bacterium]